MKKKKKEAFSFLRPINPIKPVDNDGFAVSEVKNKGLECRLLGFFMWPELFFTQACAHSSKSTPDIRENRMEALG